MLHPKVVAKLVGHGGGDQADHLRVPHTHPSRELISADRTFQSLADHATVKLDPREQLSVVIWELLDKSLPTIVEEVGQGGVPVCT